MLEVKNISKSYKCGCKAIDNISFNINEGTLNGLIGHNGAGKTTTLKMIMRILNIDSGDIVFDGRSILDKSYNFKKMLAYVPDKPLVLLELTGNEYLNFIADVYDIDEDYRITYGNELIKVFKMEESVNSRLDSYSHGMRKKIMIIGAFLSKAKLLILDEPLTGLDPEAIFILKNLMSDYCDSGNSIIFSTHLLDIAEDICSNFIFLNKGKIVFKGDLDDIAVKYGENKSLESLFMELIVNV